MAAVYKGSLKLNKIDGLRADKVTYQPVKLKANTKLKESPRSMRTSDNSNSRWKKVK